MSEEPRRLLEDPELSELLRDDLRVASKDADVGFDTSAGLDRLRAAIGGAPPAPPDGGVTAAASGTTKALIFGGIGLGIVAAITIGLTRPKDAPSVVTSAPSVAPNAPVVAPPSSKPIASAEVSIDDLPKELAPTPAPSASVPQSPEERLRAEMKQLAEVRSAPPARALQLANEGHQRFKSGIFYQEREALAISALVKLGRSGEAQTRARTFLSTFPRGPYAERVRREAGIVAP